GAGGRQSHGQTEQGENAEGRDPSRGPPVVAALDEGGQEDDEQERGEPDLDREGRQSRAHGFRIRASKGTGAVSTEPSAMAGSMPKARSTPTSRTRATHSGPLASSRWWKCGEGGPQKICLATRRTYTAVSSVPSTAGKSHHPCSDRQAPMNVSSSA